MQIGDEMTTIREQVFAAFRGWRKADQPSHDDICICADGCGCEDGAAVDCESAPLTEHDVDAETWESFLQIAQAAFALPGTVICGLAKQTWSVPCCAQSRTDYIAHVTLYAGLLRLTRKFMLTR